ncbi:2-amino-4-hydroxy-6-hydroxymethyldihydropteridine pyrophosphokinase [Idiomarina sp. A28L]|uniref:2-amino-4-hydroxy-6- hydroxymethyldihydropteridine diphosphokinase n=1 Tax=Idiomarina sp. A28L TaxID=1036674 RepID=UPI000213896C|nr:2-amino-4-hydroxy-6-hydroxymethyldihydropteridine diphosphokinase [Idiomarina sp. A28L]EGN76215.1 2-amino-4-hydroxy-6-hydroxymethyldihydropteridine pyrophosphokinase [Idiomarina sp. A28L]
MATEKLISIGIGSNINREANIRGAVLHLSRHYPLLQVSPVYESEALGFTGPPFYNLVVSFFTSNTLLEVQQQCKDIEESFGRPAETEKYSSRTLDLDILMFGDRVQENSANGEPDLPRSEILTSAFVLKPLADLHPLHRHPTKKQSFQELWKLFLHSDEGQQQALTVVSFRW